MSHIKYRPDIDGLRAIAILAVVGFHATPSYFPGGFVGVDIFFVISGFLISTIIFGELEAEKFSLKNFYFRRIRRIFPALLLLMLSCGLFGWVVLLPDEFRQLGKHIAGGNAFISNFILWKESGYFDNSSSTKPLLHLWSLGIEEQFYFLWPILLALIWRSHRGFLTVTLAVGFLSFIANLYSLQHHSSAATFYLPVYRFWELMIGGVLAYLTLHKNQKRSLKTPLKNLQSLLGLLLILLAGILINQEAKFPGTWALLPTLGSFMLISSQGAWLNKRVLSSRPLVYIGLISYPLYLWHWVILSFAHILEFTNAMQTTIAVGLSFVLAVLTYECLEKSLKKFRSHVQVYILSLLSLLLFFIGVAIYTGKITPRNNSRGIELAMEAVGDWESNDGLEKSMINGLEAFTKYTGNEKVLFYGDSHMLQYSPRIVKLIEEDPENTKSAVFITSGGCPPILNVFGRENRDYCNCRPAGKAKIIEYALSPEVDSVVIAAYWARYFSPGQKHKPSRFYYLAGKEKVYFNEGGIDLAIQELEDLLVSISSLKKVYLVIDNPSGKSFNPKNHFSGNRLSGYIDNDLKTQRLNRMQSEIRELMLSLAKRTGAIVIDPVNLLCDDDYNCRTVMEDGKPVYKDGNHVRPFYVREYMDIFDVTVKKE